MDYPENDITKCSMQLISCINNFRGRDSYVIDAIHRVQNMPTTLAQDITIEKPKDVASLISLIATNRI